MGPIRTYFCVFARVGCRVLEGRRGRAVVREGEGGVGVREEGGKGV